MEIKEKLYTLSERIEKIVGQIKTEEGTKQSLILPFFQILGYDVFNPLEFCPEFDADYGIKKGEKVDYAILIDGEPTILVEAKACSDNLDKHGAQLFRYFNSSKAKFGVLTNGIKYRFFTDLDETNKMDIRPFFEIDLSNLNDTQILYLKNFERDSLDVNSILSTAEELKYSNLIKDFLKQQLTSPTEDFANYILSQIYEGRKTATVIEKFLPIIKRAFNQLITETLSTKFAETLKGEAKLDKNADTIDKIIDLDSSINKIITTNDELEGFAIIKSILRSVINPNDITYKDTESYFGILYKNNTRKWICRLYLGCKKSIVFPTDDKSQERYYIETLNDLYLYEEQLKSIISKFI
ncbi:endonuclease [Clostridium botulinum]|uniref:type I restriction endonuclease n=1 Tax=Clostridium botulinum TaxID=1491 RepID=UPI00059726D6|nr:type I restriction endonuclease [Clostridium botulinum]KIL06619.1 endonuclease [Clostridium botulinum]MBY6934545.1 type I restriction enzyme HsdR N-terminal domain-containing protein [Clostridium botulinum]NFL83519.1 endonuclease [Clostridium botulinum]NFN11854.1 endonuclease [Clostridium botulinum]NFO36379.1 endonuclease [Clostridium botulinum]